MRLVLVTNGLRYGGAERIIEALAFDLTVRGHAVHVVATTRGGPIADALRAARIPVSVLHIASRFDARVPLKLIEVARRFRADLLHSHLAVADIATSVAAPLLGVPSVTTVHNLGTELSRLKRLLWEVALAGFERVLAVSPQVQQALPVDVPAEVVRPSLISQDEPLLPRHEARRALGIPPGVPLLLSIGRLSRVKGFDVLADAIELLRTPHVRAVVIGEGEERAALTPTRLKLVGARDDAARLLRAADMVVCPSRSEGFPQVPLHAMVAAIPVVATRVGGTPDIVRHEETGLLVPPEDPLALAGAIDALLGDTRRARTLGEAGRISLLSRGFTREAMVDEHVRIYGEVLDGSPRM